MITSKPFNSFPDSPFRSVVALFFLLEGLLFAMYQFSRGDFCFPDFPGDLPCSKSFVFIFITVFFSVSVCS